MVKNWLDNILNKKDKMTATVEFPGVLSQMNTDDAAFELSISNSIQRCKLYHRSSVYRQKFEYVVKHAIGIIFVNTHSKGLRIKEASEDLPLEEELASLHRLFNDL